MTFENWLIKIDGNPDEMEKSPPIKKIIGLSLVELYSVQSIQRKEVSYRRSLKGRERYSTGETKLNYSIRAENIPVTAAKGHNFTVHPDLVLPVEEYGGGIGDEEHNKKTGDLEVTIQLKAERTFAVFDPATQTLVLNGAQATSAQGKHEQPLQMKGFDLHTRCPITAADVLLGCMLHVRPLCCTGCNSDCVDVPFVALDISPGQLSADEMYSCILSHLQRTPARLDGKGLYAHRHTEERGALLIDLYLEESELYSLKKQLGRQWEDMQTTADDADDITLRKSTAAEMAFCSQQFESQHGAAFVA